MCSSCHRMATGGEASDPWDLTCTELMTPLETPPRTGQSPMGPWHSGLDGSAISSDSGGIFEWASKKPNMDELWICEQERIDGQLSER
eukprot:9355507-Pyramimonas_sp.AAC.1